MNLHPTLIAKVCGYDTLGQWLDDAGGDHPDLAIRVARCARILHTMDYREYLRTPNWRTMRSSIVQRDGEECVACRQVVFPLHVHHLSYKHRGFESFDELVTLCAICHGQAHGKSLDHVLDEIFGRAA